MPRIAALQQCIRALLLVSCILASALLHQQHQSNSDESSSYSITRLQQQQCSTSLNVLAVSAVPNYLGCYRDKADMQHRAMPNVQLLNTSMTHEMCFNLCSEHGFEYAGLQYQSECYCSRDAPLYEKISESECTQMCGGNKQQKCGGALALSVYRDTSVAARVPDPVEAARPLVCLVMIVKDEAHTIISTLGTVKEHVDCWHVLGALLLLLLQFGIGNCHPRNDNRRNRDERLICRCCGCGCIVSQSEDEHRTHVLGDCSKSLLCCSQQRSGLHCRSSF